VKNRHRAVQDGVLDTSDVLIDRIQRRAAAGSNGRSVLHGSQKRKKYQEESTNVSMVRLAPRRPPQMGSRVEETLVERQG